MKTLLSTAFSNTGFTRLLNLQYELESRVEEKENKRVIKIKAPVNTVAVTGKKGNEQQPRINYFAGPHCVFDARLLK